MKVAPTTFTNWMLLPTIPLTISANSLSKCRFLRRWDATKCLSLMRCICCRRRLSMLFSKRWKNLLHTPFLFLLLRRSTRFFPRFSHAVRFTTLTVWRWATRCVTFSTWRSKRVSNMKKLHSMSLRERLMAVCAMRCLSLTKWHRSQEGISPTKPPSTTLMCSTMIIISW